MEGSVERSGWASSEGYEGMQRYESAEAHAFQPFQTPLQQQLGSGRISGFFQAPLGTPIPPPPPLLMDLLARDQKRKSVEEDEDVRIVGPSAPKKKKAASTIAKKPTKKKNVKKEDEDESAAKNWKDCDVETMIALRGEMEPEFLKNAKKQGEIFLKL